MFAGRRNAAIIPPIEKMPQSRASKRVCFDFRFCSPRGENLNPVDERSDEERRDQQPYQVRG